MKAQTWSQWGTLPSAEITWVAGVVDADEVIAASNDKVYIYGATNSVPLSHLVSSGATLSRLTFSAMVLALPPFLLVLLHVLS